MLPPRHRNRPAKRAGAFQSGQRPGRNGPTGRGAAASAVGCAPRSESSRRALQPRAGVREAGGLRRGARALASLPPARPVKPVERLCAPAARRENGKVRRPPLNSFPTKAPCPNPRGALMCRIACAIVLLLAGTSLAPVQTKECNEEHAKWIAIVMDSMEKIKPGMTRQFVESVYHGRRSFQWIRPHLRLQGVPLYQNRRRVRG